LTLGLAPLALAQELRWRLPPLGAAEYERTIRAHGAVAETAVAARALVPRDRVPERLLSPLLPAPWLCQRELDADQQRIADPVRDLRDVVRAVAFDLGALRASCRSATCWSRAASARWAKTARRTCS
jgi:hypothetical protein